MHRNKIDMPRTKRLTRRAFALYAALVLVCCAATPVLAEGDPLTVVNNLSTFIFSIIRGHRPDPAGLGHCAGGPVAAEP